MKNPITLIACLLLALNISAAHLVTTPPSDLHPSNYIDHPADPNVKGYSYNLVAFKGESIGGAPTLDFSGKIVLDGRRAYKYTFKKKEHFQFDNFALSDGQLYILPGYHQPAKLIKHSKSKDYYVALKFGNAWSQYTYDEIMANRSTEVGTDIGLENCNFKKEIYDYDNSWKLTAYFEIKPIYYDASKAKEGTQNVIVSASGMEQMPILIDY